ncbi:MAG TPA: class I SAM-dependent methyltransferase [Leptolyngbyaceae cyanobacterium]
MINILQNRQEIDAATLKIQSLCLPLHLDFHKNWDHLLLYNAIATIGKQSQIIDLGCGECCTLNFLAALGFNNLHGIDLQISYDANTAYTLHQGNLTQTPLVNGKCDVAISISVIEHGVEIAAFFAEVSRLLKIDGLLFLTTDYWAEYIEIDSSIQPFGLEWKVFSAPDIEQLIALAQEKNLVLAQAVDIPACSDRPVSWYDYKYTFIALLFRKVATSEC